MKQTLVGIVFIIAIYLSSSRVTADIVRGGYYPSWISNELPPSAVATTYFTHLFYAFVNPNPTTSALDVKPEDEQTLSALSSLPTKKLISIAGNRDVIAGIAADPSRSGTFIQSAIATARKYGLDGLDLDYEYPKTQKEMSDLAQLVRLWRSEITKEASSTNKPPLLLTAAVYYASTTNGNQYPISDIADNLDWINVMAYDLHGTWESSTGLHAALNDPTSDLSTSYGINSWIKAGMPAKKIVLGLPLYGYRWTLKDAANHGVGEPATGIKDDTLRYYQVVDLNKKNGATEVYDEQRVGTYSFAGTTWIGYDSPTSTAAKVEFAKQQGLGGYFIWYIGQDDNWAITQRAFESWKN